MSVASMTGFARAEGQDATVSWAWEIKSVNGKSLDLRFRLPPGYDQLEVPMRAALAQRFKRGNVSISLNIVKAAASGGLRINREALAQIIGLAKEIETQLDVAPARIDGILSLRGVLDSGEEPADPEAHEKRVALIQKDGERALDELAGMRLGEGARLKDVLESRLGEIEDFVAAAESSAAAQPEALKIRLRELVRTLLDASPVLPEERLAQEAALLVAKADVREELDRLTAHIAAARDLLAEGAAIGRRFDFLCQEFNREANTLCSKSADVELTRVGLALKASIEQLREQVQNIE